MLRPNNLGHRRTMPLTDSGHLFRGRIAKLACEFSPGKPDKLGLVTPLHVLRQGSRSANLVVGMRKNRHQSHGQILAVAVPEGESEGLHS